MALLSLSDLDTLVTFFALSRLGYTVMMISPSLSGSACVSLLETVGCETMIYGRTPGVRATVGDILRQRLMNCSPMHPCSSNSMVEMRPSAPPRHRNPENIALILHSAGSAGSPKPLFLSHRALMAHPPRGISLISINPLPWYHFHGLSIALQAMHMWQTAYMWNDAPPLTDMPVLSLIRGAQPDPRAGMTYMMTCSGW